MQERPLNVLSLCSGYGGLELGLRVAGIPARTVLYVEREAYAAAVLDARMREGALDEAPVVPDLVALDASCLRGHVDLITAGFPCQPWSVAGRRRGKGDERWIWPAIARIIREVAPSLVFLENVPGLVSGGGLAGVLGDLAALGFDAEWDLFSAAAVGAPHKRERVFILAYSDRPVLRGLSSARSGATGGAGEGLAHAGCSCDHALESVALSRRSNPAYAGGAGSDMADPHGGGLRERTDATISESMRWSRSRESSGGERPVADTDGGGRRGDGLRPPDNGERQTCGDDPDGRSDRPWDLPLFPPAPSDTAAWEAVLRSRPDLHPAVECKVRPVADVSPGGMGDGIGRLDQLRALGNGVCPPCAALAFLVLSRRAMNEEE